MSSAQKDFRDFKGKIFEHELMAPWVTYKIGGPARYFLLPQDNDDILSAINSCEKNKIPFFILGSGSNLLIRDSLYKGAIIYLGPHLSSHLKVLQEDEDTIQLKVPAQMSKARLLEMSFLNSWSGLEFSAGIPGSMGGAVFMNAGTKWGQYADVIDEVELFSQERGFFKKTNAEMGFRYRGIGQGILDGKTIISALNITLKKEKDSSGIQKKMDEILCYRGQKQPLELPNCGSVFMNPENHEKGAGRLIEACKIKGHTIGGAQISLKHANFILNKGNAKASDVQNLISFAQETVYKEFKVELHTEVITL